MYELTVLLIGPGVWELRAKGQSRDSKYRTTSSTRAIPTLTHMTFVKLHQVCVCVCEGGSGWVSG